MRRGDYFIVGFFALLSISIVWFNFFRDRDKVEIEEVSVVPAEVIPEQQRYGFAESSFSMVTGIVHINQMLSNVLVDFGVNTTLINIAVEKAKGIFDVRKFRSGSKYLGFHSQDSLSNLAYLVYETDPVNYVVFQFTDSIKVWAGEKQIDTIRKSFAGGIKSSLWNTFTDNSANPVLTNSLSEIYAWSIDFFGLQVGDSIKVIYDELYVDSLSVGVGQIHGAWFKHMNKEFWAVPFNQDNILSFFDDNGKSLKKAFLKAPLRFSRISSRFSNSRLHPILKIRRPHHGIDYAAPVGTPVHAIGDGVIVQTSNDGGAGNMVKVKHNSVYSTAYLHLKSYAKGIHRGAYVKQGDIIGYVGSTGLSTGPHLDFRFYKNGFPVDPLKVEAPPVDPIKDENIEVYVKVKNDITSQLKSFN